MNDQTASPDPEIEDDDLTDSVLQRAVWMAGDLGIDMPPVPGVYVDALLELFPGQIFATDPDLLSLDTPEAIAEQVARLWPKAGLAFGFTVRGSRARWVYTLASASQVLSLSLGIDLADAAARRASISVVNAVHRQLETYLSNPTHYQRSIATLPPGDMTARSVIILSDRSGVPTEVHASWLLSEGMSDFVGKAEVFVAERPEIPDVEHIIWA